MAKRPVTTKETFTVGDESREVVTTMYPSATYKWGVLKPGQTSNGWEAESWCKSSADADFVAGALFPDGNLLVAKYHPEKFQKVSG
jgi:hypothetical protein